MIARKAIIVAHGQPSDPGPAARGLAHLAEQVAQNLPGWNVGSATLAEPGALGALAARMQTGVIFPMFMAGGWFTRVQIPARLAEAGQTDWQVLEPFGCDPGVHDLAVQVAREAGPAAVLLAAHGSFKTSVPSDVARHVAARIARELGIRAEAAFIDQMPQLDSVTGFGEGTVCLPFFAAAGGHVTDDIPAALTRAGFLGRLLPALGLDARVPAIIAAAITAGQSVCTTECRWRR
jgi:sirohydrochlorin ferrochelatase